MATVEDVVTRVLAATDVSAERPIGYELVARWISDRYRRMSSRIRFRHRRQLGVLALSAAIDTGTATATRGSTAVVLDADAIAAIGATSIAGRYIRLSVTWYQIESFFINTITLSTAYAEDDATDSSYTIVKRHYELEANTRWLGKFVHMRRRQEIANRALAVLDMGAPERRQVGPGPIYWSEVGRGSNDRIQIELYPYAQDAEAVHYVYWDKPTDLGLTSDIPDGIDEHVLMEGALIDLFRYRASQEMNLGNVEAAAYWRNESRAQATSWERDILEAAKADRPVDDITFIYYHLGLQAPSGVPIRTAREEIWSRDVAWN